MANGKLAEELDELVTVPEDALIVVKTAGVSYKAKKSNVAVPLDEIVGLAIAL